MWSIIIADEQWKGENTKRRKRKGIGRDRERGEKGEEQKGKLVHAMIMVVNQKSDNLLQKKKST